MFGRKPGFRLTLPSLCDVGGRVAADAEIVERDVTSATPGRGADPACPAQAIVITRTVHEAVANEANSRYRNTNCSLATEAARPVMPPL